MTETLQPTTEPVIARPNRLNQAVAWVAIVAGVVFVVGAIFFTGFFLGRHSGVDGGRSHGRSMYLHHPRMEPGMMPPPVMAPGMMPPPGMAPGMMAPPAGPSPSQSASTPPARP
jgi:hypothetical protein